MSALAIASALCVLVLLWLWRNPACPRCGCRSWLRNKWDYYWHCKGCCGRLDPKSGRFRK